MNCNVFVHNFRLQTTITFIFITSLVLSCKFSRTEGHRNPLISACPGEGNSITVYYISISTSDLKIGVMALFYQLILLKQRSTIW